MVRAASRETTKTHPLRLARWQRGLSQEALAAAVGAERRAAMRAERGETIRPDTIGRLSRFLKQSPEALGLVPEREVSFAYLTGRQFVQANAELHKLRDPRSATQRALEEVDLVDAADRAISTYSKGMRQRAKLASALVHEPQVLLLDEPFNGVDPRQRMHLMELLTRMGEQGRTVLFSSHILEEVEHIARHVEVVVSGRHAASGDFGAIRRLMTDRPTHYTVRSSDDRRLAAALMGQASVRSVALAAPAGTEEVHVEVTDMGDFARALPALARDAGITVRELRPTDESLESVFTYLVAS